MQRIGLYPYFYRPHNTNTSIRYFNSELNIEISLASNQSWTQMIALKPENQPLLFRPSDFIQSCSRHESPKALHYDDNNIALICFYLFKPKLSSPIIVSPMRNDIKKIYI